MTECLLAVVEEVIYDGEMKVGVTSAIKTNPSDTVRGVEIRAADVFQTLLEELKKADVLVRFH